MAFKVQVQAYDGSTTADSAIVTTNYPPPPGAGIVCKVYNGTTWDTATVKVYNGSTWDTATPKIYDGTGWEG